MAATSEPVRVSAETAAEVVRRRLGPITAVTPLAGAVQNTSYAVTGDAGDWIVKFGLQRSLESEAWALDALPGWSIPAPLPVFFETRLPETGSAMLIMHRLPGRPGDSPEALREAGRIVRRLHTSTPA